MVDLRVRKNEKCVIGLPECNYVFSSTNSCFIAYGFNTSTLEKDILAPILQEKGIEPIEAGNRIASGEFAFCTKICSKIITSRFCIVLLNNDVAQKNDTTFLAPNANVNIEYGLMIGFNKFVIPFQEEKYDLPFNVAALDTVKYSSSNFREKANKAIEDAITKTSPSGQVAQSFDEILNKFFLLKNMILSKLGSQGEKDIFALGATFGLNMFTSFDGMSYQYFGNFPSLPAGKIIWRLGKLRELIHARRSTFDERVLLKLSTPQQLSLAERVISALKIWLLVADEEQKRLIEEWRVSTQFPYPLETFTVGEVMAAVENI